MIVVGASAYPRFIDFARFRAIADEVGAVLVTDMAHISGLVAGGSHPSPVGHSHIVTSTTHKTLRGPRSGFILSKEDFKKQINKLTFPGTQGGPLVHVVAAKAVCFKQAMTEEFKAYARQIVANAEVLAESLTKEGLRLVSGGTDNHLVLLDVGAMDVTGKDAEKSRNRRYHRQQKHHPLRHATASRGERNPGWHAGRHDAGHEGDGDAFNCRLDRQGDPRMGGRDFPSQDCRPGEGAVRELSAFGAIAGLSTG